MLLIKTHGSSCRDLELIWLKLSFLITFLVTICNLSHEKCPGIPLLTKYIISIVTLKQSVKTKPFNLRFVDTCRGYSAEASRK